MQKQIERIFVVLLSPLWLLARLLELLFSAWRIGKPVLRDELNWIATAIAIAIVTAAWLTLKKWWGLQ